VSDSDEMVLATHQRMNRTDPRVTMMHNFFQPVSPPQMTLKPREKTPPPLLQTFPTFSFVGYLSDMSNDEEDFEKDIENDEMPDGYTSDWEEMTPPQAESSTSGA
jgi:hypothetical protein